MLVTFKCKGYSSIPMFQDVAVQLLHLMQHSGTVPGAFAIEDVPLALEALQAHVEHQPMMQVGADKISLRQRAVPLLGLLQHAADAKYRVIWE